MKKLLVLFFLFLISYLLNPAYASNISQATYDVSYQVQDSGTTHGVFNIVLTNTTSNYFASSYKLQLGFTHISNVKASDPNGPIVPTVFKQDTGTNIEVKFNDKAVGKGASIPFTLSFDTDDIVQKQGSIWEINIPGIANQNSFKDFKAKISVPKFLGTPSYIKPSHSFNNLSFTKAQLGTSGISLAFGDEQLYEFNVTYHLQNNGFFPKDSEIALPPSTNYQNVEIESINPPPLNVRRDQDGNWLAKYTLLPSSKLTVTVAGKARVVLSPTTQPETDSSLSMYLKDEPYWDSNDSRIVAIASNLKTPQDIYNYVVTHLSYNYNRALKDQTRLGAIGVLADPANAVCLEFTDLFIALSRAAGIPAREVDGFAYTQNPTQRPLSKVLDILHSWPEYYDRSRQTWIMVDPTWGQATAGIDYFHSLDFDHLAFVIKGLDSSNPMPAGAYKILGSSASKDINVTFADNFDEGAPTLEVNTKEVPTVATSGLPIRASVELRNTSSFASPAQTITVTSDNLSPSSQQIPLDLIPPYGSIVVPINYHQTGFLTSFPSKVTIQIGGNTITKDIKIAPIFLTSGGLLGGIAIVIFIIGISITARKFRRLSILGRK